jgi:hypothetical protein
VVIKIYKFIYSPGINIVLLLIFFKDQPFQKASLEINDVFDGNEEQATVGKLILLLAYKL